MTVNVQVPVGGVAQVALPTYDADAVTVAEGSRQMFSSAASAAPYRGTRLCDARVSVLVLVLGVRSLLVVVSVVVLMFGGCVCSAAYFLRRRLRRG